MMHVTSQSFAKWCSYFQSYYYIADDILITMQLHNGWRMQNQVSYYISIYDCMNCVSNMVLAMGPGDPPAVQVWTAKTGLFSSRPIQKSEPLTIGGPNPDPYPWTCGIWRVGLNPLVPISNSVFRVPQLWWHSNMLLSIVTYGHWYGTVCFWNIGHLNAHNKHKHGPYHILKMSVNGASTIFGRVSWVIWGATGFTKSLTKYWPPL